MPEALVSLPIIGTLFWFILLIISALVSYRIGFWRGVTEVDRQYDRVRQDKVR